MNRIKYFIIITFLIFVYCFSVLGQNKSSIRPYTVVIDAGHGGKDTGNCHNHGREKDITLSVALKLGAVIKNKYPEIRVLYTRTKDVFVGLQERCDFANSHHANLFISIHVNSAPSVSAKGCETYVLGLNKLHNNLNVAMRENKAMLLERDYSTLYKGFDPSSTESYIMFQVMQDAYFNSSIDFATDIQRQYTLSGRINRGVRQAPLWVLSQSAMPSVLTEIGFLSNRKEARYLLSLSGQNEIVRNISSAFGVYYRNRMKQLIYKSSDNNISKSKKVINKTIETPISINNKQQNISKNNYIYRVKFMTIKVTNKKIDNRYKSFKKTVHRVLVGRWYIYYMGDETSLTSALNLKRKLHRYYKDATIVKCKGNKIIKEYR